MTVTFKRKSCRNIELMLLQSPDHISAKLVLSRTFYPSAIVWWPWRVTDKTKKSYRRSLQEDSGASSTFGKLNCKFLHFVVEFERFQESGRYSFRTTLDLQKIIFDSAGWRFKIVLSHPSRILHVQNEQY